MKRGRGRAGENEGRREDNGGREREWEGGGRESLRGAWERGVRKGKVKKVILMYVGEKMYVLELQYT